MKDRVAEALGQVKRELSKKILKMRQPSLFALGLGMAMLLMLPPSKGSSFIVHRSSNKFFFATGMAMLFIIILRTGIVAANPCLNSISGGQESESAKVETIALAEEKQSSSSQLSTTGLRFPPRTAGPVLDDFRFSISDCRFNEIPKTRKQCSTEARHIEASQIRDDAHGLSNRQWAFEINAADKYMRMDLYAALSPPDFREIKTGGTTQTWCGVSLKGEGLDRSPGPSFILLSIVDCRLRIWN